jgi:hypothetical protein
VNVICKRLTLKRTLVDTCVSAGDSATVFNRHLTIFLNSVIEKKGSKFWITTFAFYGKYQLEIEKTSLNFVIIYGYFLTINDQKLKISA